jgi:hypothetical protein
MKVFSRRERIIASPTSVLSPEPGPSPQPLPDPKPTPDPSPDPVEGDEAEDGGPDDTPEQSLTEEGPTRTEKAKALLNSLGWVLIAGMLAILCFVLAVIMFIVGKRKDKDRTPGKGSRRLRRA